MKTTSNPWKIMPTPPSDPAPRPDYHGAPLFPHRKTAVRAFVGLGSNTYPAFQHLRSAISQLANLPFCQYVACSSFYYTAPVGGPPQPPFLNAVIIIDTCLSAIDFFTSLTRIEKMHGRIRQLQSIRWGPRTLDCDLLLFGTQTLRTPLLQIPHPRMKTRRFVLAPLHELIPHLLLPCGTSVYQCLHTPTVHQQPLVRLTEKY